MERKVKCKKESYRQNYSPSPISEKVPFTAMQADNSSTAPVMYAAGNLGVGGVV